MCTSPAFASLPCLPHNQHYVARLFGCSVNYIISQMKLYICVCEKSSGSEKKSINIGKMIQKLRNLNKYEQYKYTLIKRLSKTNSEGVLAMPKNKLLNGLE